MSCLKDRIRQSIRDKLRKNRTLTKGGEFSLLKGIGTTSGRQSAHPYQINGLRTHLSRPQLKLQDKRRVCQIGIKVTFNIKREYKNFTWKRLTARIDQPWGFESQSFSATEGANLPKIEFFDAMARLEPGLAQLSDAPNQSG
jgi:hypothetical protein